MDLATSSPQKNTITLASFEEHLHSAIGKPTTNFRMRRIGPQRKKRKIHNGAHRASWAKTTINHRLRTISINVFLNF